MATGTSGYRTVNAPSGANSYSIFGNAAFSVTDSTENFQCGGFNIQNASVYRLNPLAILRNITPPSFFSLQFCVEASLGGSNATLATFAIGIGNYQLFLFGNNFAAGIATYSALIPIVAQPSDEIVFAVQDMQDGGLTDLSLSFNIFGFLLGAGMFSSGGNQIFNS